MIKDISTIKIQGANFDLLTTLDIFDPRDGKDKQGNDNIKNVKGALLYGRNGTGKSTIAKAFRAAKGEDITAIKQVSLNDIDGNFVTLSEEEKKRIFVFDEDFVNEKVKIKSDHLDTIIMLGPVADLAEKIEKAEAEKDAAKLVFETKDAEFKEFQDINNPKSPKRCLWKIAETLRGDDSWAGRDKIINDRRQNSQVRDDTYKKFIELEPKKTRSKLIVEFDEQLAALENAKSGSSKIEIKVPTIPEQYNGYDDDAIAILLAKKIEKPELSEREQYLMSLVEKGMSEELSNRAEVFRNTDLKNCPYCFQPLSNDYRLNLVSSIEKVLSETVAKHQNELEELVYNEVFIDISAFSELPSYNTCITQLDSINNAIQINNNLIQQKIGNPYQEIETSNINIADEIKQLAKSLTTLEEERAEFNRAAADTKPIIAKLNKINSLIAHYDIKNLATEYDKQIEESSNAEKSFNAAKADYHIKKKALEDLEAERKNVKLAINIINAYLKYIFFAEDRLSIDYRDGEYRLYSHGKSVRPCDISVGERNIIGLSYFFTTIMEGQEEKDVYNKDYLIVIDDPVSSYDTENRIGILSFLKYSLGAFLEGNEFTRTLVMTHDLMSFYDIHKVLEEIVTCCKRNGYANKPKFNRYELTDSEIKTFEYKGRQEYSEILKLIYDYGQGNTSKHDLVIGNLMRQALEAFATFQYKKGIEDVSTDPEILALLPDPEYKTYFENLMYRLVLHGSSHREEQIKAMKDYDFFNLISESEKQRTAKEVLCFIYLLNKRHILQHLHDIKNVEITLDTWCNEIKARATMP